MFMSFDVLIIGSGLAGQSAALRLAPTCRVGLISKRSLEESASRWAQGGIAAVIDQQDSIDAHIQDTIVAGAFLNDPSATRFVIEKSRSAIDLKVIAPTGRPSGFPVSPGWNVFPTLFPFLNPIHVCFVSDSLRTAHPPFFRFPNCVIQRGRGPLLCYFATSLRCCLSLLLNLLP